MKGMGGKKLPVSPFNRDELGGDLWINKVSLEVFSAISQEPGSSLLGKSEEYLMIFWMERNKKQKVHI